jgi:hypothetical protein
LDQKLLVVKVIGRHLLLVIREPEGEEFGTVHVVA